MVETEFMGEMQDAGLAVTALAAPRPTCPFK
jgi:hypothetical protein